MGGPVPPCPMGALLLAGWVGLVTLGHSLLVAGVPVTEWARDATTYLLISAGVVVGFDAAATLRPKHARLLTAGTGALFAFGFAAYWLQRRQATGSGVAAVGHSLLASAVALVAPFALAVVLGWASRRIRWTWVALASGLTGSVLVTGTRSGLVFAFVAVGIVGFSATRVRSTRLVVGATAAVGTLILLLPTAAAWTGSGNLFVRRAALAVNAFTNGVTQDRSGEVRARAYDYAARAFWEHPWLGQGVGRTFPNPNPGGGPRYFSLDTPLLYVAKFGLIGVPVLAAAMLMIAASLIRLAPRTVEQTAASGALAVLVGFMPFGSPTEDKGFIVMIALLMALVGAAARDRVEPTTIPSSSDQTPKQAPPGAIRTGPGSALLTPAARRADLFQPPPGQSVDRSQHGLGLVGQGGDQPRPRRVRGCVAERTRLRSQHCDEEVDYGLVREPLGTSRRLSCLAFACVAPRSY